MAPADLVCGAILLFAVVRAGVRGFVAEAFSLGAVAVGLAAAIIGNPLVLQQLREWWEPAWWQRPAAFVVLFVAGYLVVKLVEGLFQRARTALGLKGLDHLLGLGIGAAEGLVVVYGLLVLVQVQSVVDAEPWLADSLVRERLLPWMLANLPLPELPPPPLPTAGDSGTI